MSFNHAVLWIDHQEAHVIEFNADENKNHTIKTKSQHPHNKAGVAGSGNNAAPESYLHAVIHAVADVREILIVGAGSAKLEFIRHANKHDAQVAANIVAVETVDHPGDAQLLAYAKKYFVRVDNMKGDPVVRH